MLGAQVSAEHWRHVELLWSEAVEYFEREEIGLATFFGATTVEEVGKIMMLRLRDSREERAPKGWFKHEEKYLVGVITNALVNSRLTRVYGDCEDRFASWIKERDGKMLRLFAMRNRGLYAEWVDGAPKLPNTLLRKDDACLLVCMAGELLADSHDDAAEHSRLLERVSVFLAAHRAHLANCLPK